MTVVAAAATTATTEAPDAPITPRAAWVESLRSVRERLRFVPASLRTRILVWLVGVVALATAASVLVTYQVLLARLDQRIDAELKQEADELKKLYVGKDPDTGKPFGTDVRRIFEVYFQRNVPSRNEALITFLDGRPFLRSRQVVPYDLDGDPALVARWGTLASSDRGEVQTPAGRVEYLAVPLRRRRTHTRRLRRRDLRRAGASRRDALPWPSAVSGSRCCSSARFSPGGSPTASSVPSPSSPRRHARSPRRT